MPHKFIIIINLIIFIFLSLFALQSFFLSDDKDILKKLQSNIDKEQIKLHKQALTEVVAYNNESEMINNEKMLEIEISKDSKIFLKIMQNKSNKILNNDEKFNIDDNEMEIIASNVTKEKIMSLNMIDKEIIYLIEMIVNSINKDKPVRDIGIIKKAYRLNKTLIIEIEGFEKIKSQSIIKTLYSRCANDNGKQVFGTIEQLTFKDNSIQNIFYDNDLCEKYRKLSYIKYK